LHENATASGSEINDKFQSLIREVTNTTIADLRKIGEEKYYEATSKVYTVFIAYEIHKRDMYRFMKRQAKLDAKLNEAERKAIEEIIDEELKQVEALGEGE
jgi:DNA-directed RNA polymerase specialized sigma subunit